MNEPWWVHLAGRTIGLVLLAACFVALWRVDPHYIPLADVVRVPDRAARWAVAAWRAYRQRIRDEWEGVDLDVRWQRFQAIRTNRRIRTPARHHLQRYEPDRPRPRPLYDAWREQRGWWRRRWCWWFVPPGGQQSIHGWAWTRGSARGRLAHLIRAQGRTA